MRKIAGLAWAILRWLVAVPAITICVITATNSAPAGIGFPLAFLGTAGAIGYLLIVRPFLRQSPRDHLPHGQE